MVGHANSDTDLNSDIRVSLLACIMFECTFWFYLCVKRNVEFTKVNIQKHRYTHLYTRKGICVGICMCICMYVYVAFLIKNQFVEAWIYIVLV